MPHLQPYMCTQVGDFTPNYLCNADAMTRIRNTATEPSRYRFVVVVRDPEPTPKPTPEPKPNLHPIPDQVREPVARAFSEWRSE